MAVAHKKQKRKHDLHLFIVEIARRGCERSTVATYLLIYERFYCHSFLHHVTPHSQGGAPWNES